MKTAEERFKTYGEAQKYCADNGLKIGGPDDPWEMANVIMKIRADQDKITRHACAESINEIQGCNSDGSMQYSDIVKSIINTKAI